jgi:DNA-binding winged helix-turn-helix (wHTH) protein
MTFNGGDVMFANQYLHVTREDQSELDVQLNKVCTSIGRSQESDIRIYITEEHLCVSRVHCTIELEGAICWIKNKSSNAPFLRQKQGQKFQVNQQMRLQDGDVFFIHAGFDQAKRARYWQFEYHDSHATTPTHMAPYLEFTTQPDEVFKVTGNTRILILLSPIESKIISYMRVRNEKNNGRPALVLSEELIRFIWQGPNSEGRDLYKYISSLRKKLQIDAPDVKNSVFIQTIHTRGYKLVTHPVPALPGDSLEVEEAE